jgi:hypothetical protein
MSSAEAWYSMARVAEAIISPALGPVGTVRQHSSSKRRHRQERQLTDDVNTEDLISVLLNDLHA